MPKIGRKCWASNMYEPSDAPVQLAKNFDAVPKGKRKGPWLGQIKYDGLFAYGLCLPGDTRIFSRTGKQFYSLQHIERGLAEVSSMGIKPVVVIFEVYEPGQSVNIISGRTRRESEQYPEAIGMVHDCIPYEDFIQGVCTLPYRVRLAAGMHIGNSVPCFRAVESFDVAGEETALEIAKQLIDSGQEGLVLKQPDGVWLAGKRNEQLMKIKQELSFDLKVQGVEPGEGKYAGTLGKLVLRFRRFGKKSGELCKLYVSGMTDDQRHEWWNDPDSIIGQVVQVDAMTFSAHGLLREPRYKCIRFDKKADF